LIHQFNMGAEWGQKIRKKLLFLKKRWGRKAVEENKGVGGTHMGSYRGEKFWRRYQ